MKPVLSILQRRNFLKLMGAVPATGSVPAWAQSDAVSLLDQSGAVAAGHAIKALSAALAAHGVKLNVIHDLGQAQGLVILLAAPGAPLAAGFAPPAADWASPDCLRLVPGKIDGHDALLVSAVDPRGFVYSLHELAERVEFGGPVALHLGERIEEKSPNRVRSVARAFVSEIDDKPWFYDRQGWRDYLDMLVAARFNRFSLTLGIGYDFPKGVTGDYLHFPYPYLVEVPGYKVTITPALAAGERKKNLETLKFIARETGARGLDFQLGLWTHAWAWTDSPKSDHVIGGLNDPQGKADWSQGAAYSRDALAILLKQCPEITGVTLRVHGESGVPEGSYPFWQTLFEAIAKAGRKIEIDMHAKGINQIMFDMAAKTGQPVKVGPKYSAEHQSLAYHQADIRELEIPTPGRVEQGVFSVSNGERRFTRYGYADLYQEGRGFDILYRLWPGTQRHLLSADPAWAAAMGRTANFCGAAGLEICEPLFFKGREGSGNPGGRNAYLAADKTKAENKDWRKFAESYRLWGRMLYNPQATPESWRRSLKHKFGAKAQAAERALAAASRILPLLTSAHLPSAANHSLWHEMYTNQPVVDGTGFVPYSDTPSPRVFANVSPLDPQLFSSIAEHAGDLLAGRASAKYSPAEVAAWLDGLSRESGQAVAELGADAATRQVVQDVTILRGIADFFAAKLRSGVYFALWQKNHDPATGAAALQYYQQARAAWAAMAEGAKRIYAADISYGEIPQRRGHWLDRLPAMDADIAAMKTALSGPAQGPLSGPAALVAAPQQRPAAKLRHIPPERFTPGADLPLVMSVEGSGSAELFYRHVNQGERWRSMAMLQQGDTMRAAIPGDYTHSPYPLQYYFVLRNQTQAWMAPGFNASFSNQPYFAVWKRN